MLISTKEQLKDEIETLKEELVSCSLCKEQDSLTDPEVYELSKELDEKILEYMI